MDYDEVVTGVHRWLRTLVVRVLIVAACAVGPLAASVAGTGLWGDASRQVWQTDESLVTPTLPPGVIGPPGQERHHDGKATGTFVAGIFLAPGSTTARRPRPSALLVEFRSTGLLPSRAPPHSAER